MSELIFKIYAPKYWDKNISVVPVIPGTKQGIKAWGNYNNNLPKQDTRDQWVEKCSDHGIALSMGFEVVPGNFLIGLDIDHDAYVSVLERAFGQTICGKKGRKGITAFFRCPERLKKLFFPKSGDRILDILGTGSICVIPPSVHPDTRIPYEWVGQNLLDIDFMELPTITKVEIEMFGAILNAPEHIQIMTGESTHDEVLRLTAKLVKVSQDADLIEKMISAFFPNNYRGNSLKEIRGMIESAIENGFAVPSLFSKSYDPGFIGPKPMGYTQRQEYIFYHQQKRLIVSLTPNQLITPASIIDLASTEFWSTVCPKVDKDGRATGNFQPQAIADLLMRSCKEVGPFDTSNIYGSGIYLENGKVIQNIRGEVPVSSIGRTYVRFQDLAEYNGLPICPKNVFGFFKQFWWEDPYMAELAMGWTVLGPICGALEWRTHIVISGQAGTGKTTLLKGISSLCSPLGLNLQGATTEAGIRQSLQADSRAVTLDEFETDHGINSTRKVMRLIRSSSAADTRIVKGSVDGKAIYYEVRSAFALGAVYQLPLEPADKTRIIELSLRQHASDQKDRENIIAIFQEFESMKGAWPNFVIGKVDHILSSISKFQTLMPAINIRHAQNISNLFGAFYAAIYDQLDLAEIRKFIDDRMELIQKLSAAHEDSDPERCLDIILAIKVDRDFTVRSLVAQSYKDERTWDQANSNLSAYGLKILPDGLAIANQSQSLRKSFQGTVFEHEGWSRALGRLHGAAKGENHRTRFQTGNPVRYTLIPYDLINLERGDPLQDRF